MAFVTLLICLLSPLVGALLATGTTVSELHHRHAHGKHPRQESGGAATSGGREPLAPPDRYAAGSQRPQSRSDSRPERQLGDGSGLRARRSPLELASGSPTGTSSTRLKLSHHFHCEPISQLNDLRLTCPHQEQFIVILEAYYADPFPEHVCPQVFRGKDGKLAELTAAQLVRIFRQFYAPPSPAKLRNTDDQLITASPTLVKSNGKEPFCVDDLRESFQAKCSGRRECRFSRHTDHQFPRCASLKPGHAFVRYLCLDDRLLLRYCNANTLLASHSRTLGGRRSGEQVETLDFGLVASPGYPNFYATPKARRGTGQPADADRQQECGWTVEAEPGQRITVKLLDASLAPNKAANQLAPLSALPAGLDSIEYPDYSSPTGSDFMAAFSGEQLAHISATGSKPDDLLLVAPPSGSKHRGAANVQIELDAPASLVPLGDEPSRKILFKIGQHDYELIKLTLAQRLKQISEQCDDYDQLVVKDVPHGTAPATGTNDQLRTGQPAEQPKTSAEFAMISTLPISLYKNNLIDFSNSTIFRQADAQQAGGSAKTASKTIDYQSLLDGLNPLQLVWLYQQNVSLCSTSQLNQLSATSEKEMISFTSSANTIELDLISGRTFNPANRGILFWFHKHGCPFTRKLPNRSRLVFRNETTEVFECLENFVFSDTRQRLRTRHCSLDQQTWLSPDGQRDEVQLEHSGGNLLPGQGQLPPCVFTEDLQQYQHTSKFDRLIEAAGGRGRQTVGGHGYDIVPSRLMAGSGQDEVAVEVVGVPTSSQSTGVVSLNDVLVSDVDLLHQQHSTMGDSGRPSERAPQHAAGTVTKLWNDLVDLVSPRWSQSPTSPTNHSSVKLVSSADERKISAPSHHFQWAHWRLIVPAVAILTLFILLNLTIYAIFLVILPKFARLLCGPGRRERKLAPDGSSTGRHRLLGANGGTGDKWNNYYSRGAKMGHYDSEYSVTLGMSL